MSEKNKNYNSIIFLTTLSVYLGLSLLGATPQVLAYAATTRNFDVQTEIELKDDLDNKPDNEESGENQPENFPRNFAYFSAEINLYSDERNLKNHFFENFQSQSFVENFIVFGNAGNLANSYLANGYKLTADKSDLIFEVSFSKSKAEIFADYLNAKYVSFGKTAKETNLKNFYENTKVNPENNQVFIVTRLPRAGIDSLIN